MQFQKCNQKKKKFAENKIALYYDICVQICVFPYGTNTPDIKYETQKSGFAQYIIYLIDINGQNQNYYLEIIFPYNHFQYY